MINQISHHLHARSAALLATMHERLAQIFLGWMVLVTAACTARLASSPTQVRDLVDPTVGTYLLLVFAPIASALFALRWFKDDEVQPQPIIRFARMGRWRNVSLVEAQAHPLYGTSGIMVSLLVGMLLNAVFRIGEYILAIPPITNRAPEWVQLLQLAMAADAVVFASLYVIAFVTALKRIPLFPRLLVMIWLADIVMQLVIATLIGPRGDLPPGAASALKDLLYGAVQKVLISIAVWMPYLLLSKRVNVTFRLRVAN